MICNHDTRLASPFIINELRDQRVDTSTDNVNFSDADEEVFEHKCFIFIN